MKTTVLLLLSASVLLADDERTCTMRDAALPSNTVTYVLCEQGLLLTTANEGATWTTRKITDASGLRALAFLDLNHGLAAGDGGTIMATDDAGKTWARRTTGTTENLSDLQMVGQDGWAVGYDGIILHTADGGRTWSKQNSGVTQSLEAVSFLDAKNGWTAGWSGTILHTENGGETWVQVKAAGATWSLSSIHFIDPQNGFISGFAGQLIRTKDGGKTWETIKTPYSGWLTSITFDSAKRGWITTDDGFLTSTDGGTIWKLLQADPTGLEMQLFLNKLLRTSGVVWALGPFGLSKQVGDGTQWKKIGNPLSDGGTGEK
jgi:photosystem II stability/assembly factor-like uncharacterized protein